VALNLFILDACVLIDFVTTDASLLTLVADHVGSIHVASVVLAEVDQLDESDAVSLGLRVVEPDLALAADAAMRRGALSLEDWTSLLLAKDNGWTCVSNDRRLRRECTAEKVPVLWSLALLTRLVDAGALAAEAAVATVRAMHAANPRYITPRLVARFEQRVKPGRRKG
jgi:hypothetical protein